MAQPMQMSADDHGRVSAAVGAAEASTAGEIVTIVTQSSDRYADVAIWWAAFASFVALGAFAVFPDFYLGLFRDLVGGWWTELSLTEALELALVFAALKFWGVWLIMLWRPLRLALTPRRVKQQRARARAIRYFKVGAERRTTGRTGILIYVSTEEHVAEIVADEAIHGKVPQERWGEAMSKLVQHARQGKLADGMVAAIADIGAILAAHFPRAADDVNELPDRLIEL